MSRKWLLSLVCLCLLVVVFAPVSSARFDLRIDEAATTISFEQLAPTVSLAVENGSGDALTATVRLELLTPNNKAVGTIEQELKIAKGKQKLPLTLALMSRDLLANEHEVLWYRLHYQVMTASSQVPDLEGLISISQLMNDLFELRVAVSGAAREGMKYHARVRAVYPLSQRPVSNVHVYGLVSLQRSGREFVLTDSGKTNQGGYLDLEFQLPDNLDSNDFSLAIEGTRGLRTVRAEKEIDVLIHTYVLVSTDKPIYQPGQTLHARATVLSSSKRAVPSKLVTVKINDPEDTEIFQTEIKTSRFGIASFDWPIPDNTRLGDYRLEFQVDEEWSNSASVKISRYDLPNFVVNVKTDRSFYLPGQRATVTVKGDYLFGEQVPRGHVRVVRDVERSWNYREQKYETKEGAKYEGELGPDRTLTLPIDLAADFKDLEESDYQRYRDLQYTAYLTDPSTNRTEQRRFNLRLTKQPIHIYVIRPGDTYNESVHLRPTLYVSTFYADGTPAECKITLEDAAELDRGRRTLAKGSTNQYGVAKINELRLSADRLDASDLTINVLAQDKEGGIGKHAQTLRFEDEPGVRVTVPKTIYFETEPIPVTITSTERTATVTLQVVRDWSVIHSELVRIENGRASILLPYRVEFKDELVLAAFVDRGQEERILSTRSIIYPRPRDLKLNLQSTTRTYQPGEEARFTFKTSTAAGRSVETALGVVVIDKAVEERFRSDLESGSRYATFGDDYLSVSRDGDAIGSVSRKALENLGRGKQITPELDLVAEVLLNQYNSYFPTLFSTYSYDTNFLEMFSAPVESQLRPLRAALTNIYEKSRRYPTDEASLNQLLSTAGISFRSMTDPWGTPYRPQFSVEKEMDVLLIKSAGPDKKFETGDDFSVSRLSWAYFRPTGEAIDKAVQAYHLRTGGFIRDLNTLRQELHKEGVDLDRLRDPWLKPYLFKFEVVASQFVINVFAQSEVGSNGEFVVWQSKIDYFAESRARIDDALSAKSKTPYGFPQTPKEVRETLSASGIDFDTLRDPWNNQYYMTFHTLSFYGDQVRIEAQAASNGPVQQRVNIKPVSSVVFSLKLRSMGSDAKEGTVDDFDVATFATTRSQQSASDRRPQPSEVSTTFSGSTGAIAGTVSDPNGAIIANATITATRGNAYEEFTVNTNDEGRYLLRNLPAGTYTLHIDATGFKRFTITAILVRSSEVFQLNATLDVAAATETVQITAAGNSLQTASSSASTTESKEVLSISVGDSRSKSKSIAIKAPQQLFTPRLREFFPETLLWKPELITDKKGFAQLDFKLADNITTWKMSVIGLTQEGEIGRAETEIRSFQPFFAELDPPKVLTQGDRISLPVVLRNYLNKKQTIDLNLQPEQWFKILGVDNKKTEVPGGDSLTETFDLEALVPIKDGKQRVNALGSEFSDAVQKTVLVHPDGEEKSDTTSNLLQRSTEMVVELPNDTIKNSSRVELKVYPNLTSHVWESIEGIMMRPYGCGEQTISSTYPSLLILRHSKKHEPADSPLLEKARRYTQAGYQKLLGYEAPEGGFTYWGRGDPDLALTAYAIRFLLDAAEVIAVDESVVKRAQQWLLKKQRADGSWPSLNWEGKENSRSTALLTSFIARALARAKSTKCVQGAIPAASDNAPLDTALDYLQRRSEEIDEPYLIASYSLAASTACDPSRAASANRRLQKLEHVTPDGNYWALETNTPFYGWGLAGQIETTALVVQALANHNSPDPVEQKKFRDSADRGLLFLLHKKDRYGVWYSTQATINVLDGILAIAKNELPSSGSGQTVEVFVNDQRIDALQLPPDNRFVAPLTTDLSAATKIGKNRIEVRRSGSGPVASVQTVSTYWVPWTHSSNSASRTEHSQTIALEATFNKTQAGLMEEISCHVKAERIGFRGYGMLLAEIGLPPGADVDRSSLEKAMKNSYSISQYDILPDRVVLYLWPRAGGTEFDFTFRPRLRMNALSSSSSIYDYYNPEAKAVVAPTRFVVK